MIKCIAIDDEPLALEQITSYIKRTPGMMLVQACQSAEQAREAAESGEIDAMFVDINMPDLNGLDFVKSLPEAPKVVFTTAYSEYAIDGFKVNAVDYLLKPFEDGQLEAVVKKILGEAILHGQHTASPKDAELLPLKDADPEMHRYVQSAIGYIADHYSEDAISITRIAEAIGVSEGHLSRLFKKDTGQSINSYITCYRMRTAMRLLRDVRYKVYEVCEMVGYHDIAYFSSTFKKLTGMTPSDYQAG